VSEYVSEGGRESEKEACYLASLYRYIERCATRCLVCFSHVARPRGYSSREFKVHDMFIYIFVYIYTERETCSLSFSLYIYTCIERDVRRVASSASLMLHGPEDTPLVRPRHIIYESTDILTYTHESCKRKLARLAQYLDAFYRAEPCLFLRRSASGSNFSTNLFNDNTTNHASGGGLGALGRNCSALNLAGGGGSMPGIYLYLYLYLYVCIYQCMYVCRYVSVYLSIYIYMYLCLSLSLYIYIHVYIYPHAQ